METTLDTVGTGDVIYATSSEEAAVLRERALAAMLGADLAGAIASWNRLLELEPNDAGARGRLVEAQRQLELAEHCQDVAKAITAGGVVPFLGAGVNLPDQPTEDPFQPGKYLPSGTQLASYLANESHYPVGTDPLDLSRVAQYAELTSGSGPLYDQLHTVFANPFEPTSIHQLLARVPRILRSKGYLRSKQTGTESVVSLQTARQPRYAAHQLIVTTNYDDLLERAFDDEGEEYDLLTYVAQGRDRGKFLHFRSGERVGRLIDDPVTYHEVALERRTVILKIHGAVDVGREDSSADSYVITEDQYIDYLTRTELHTLVPPKLVAKLRQSRLLFLGYSLHDWNLRVILYRIWQEQPLQYNSWSIQRRPHPVDSLYWGARKVRIFDAPLGVYATRLEAALAAAPDRSAPS